MVTLSERAVLTGDAVNNGVCRFEVGKPPEKLVDKLHCPWMTRGLDGKIYAESLGESGGAWPTAIHRLDDAGRNPTSVKSSPNDGPRVRLVRPDGTWESLGQSLR